MNGWLEFQFTGSLERNLVWERRPYHVFGFLLVLLPWQPSFDVNMARIERLDLWIRIPFLPTEYMSKETIRAILKYNKIGKFIRLDAFSESKKKAKFARVCVNIKNAKTIKGYVEVPDYFQEMKDYNVWYQDILEGCRHYGEADHAFESCPLRTSSSQAPKIKVEKNPKKAVASSSKVGKASDDSDDNMEEEQGWKQVGDPKGKNQ